MGRTPLSQGHKARFWRLAFGFGAVGAVLFVIYLSILYGQLDRAFLQEQQFIPTRIYSDVERIAPPQRRGPIEELLKALGYKPSVDANTLSFTLHPIDYPRFLIPDGDPTLDAAAQLIVLSFEGKQPSAALQSIRIGGHETPDLFLEPEIAATLSRGTGGQSIRAVVAFDDVPANVWQAIIAIEDQHFMEHRGLDPRGMARAIWVNLKTLSFAQGGSTITQQLVKNLMARHSKNLIRKINELFLALLLEAKFDKNKIMERYLNEVYLGQVGNLEVHGVVEGAQHFFGKKLDDLNLAEIALMAGLIRGPGYYSPYRYWDRAIERQHLVLKKMVETGQIAQAEADAALKLPIHLAPAQTSSNKAPYFTDFVKAELIRHLKDKLNEAEITDHGFRIYTTLDLAMNSAAQKAVSNGISDLEKRLHLAASDRLEGALASVDPTTGYIRALIGGRSYARSTFNRILNMKRQVGSTFKPIVYLAAIRKGFDAAGVPYGPGHPAEDAAWKLTYDHGKQTWAPRNYEPDYLGWISYRKALAHSINTVASKLGVEIGIPQVIRTARDLGIESDLPEVPSLSLGVSELSPIELLRVYATLANHGARDDLTVIRAITEQNGSVYAQFFYNPKQLVEPGPCDLITEMLTSVFSEGTASAARAMGLDRPAAGKTGTTSHHRDAWFAGYTPQLTTVVWVGMDQTPAPLASPSPGVAKMDEGNDREQSKVILTGAGSALPIWVAYMKKALESVPPTPFPTSPELTQLSIDTHTGKRASFGCPGAQVASEWFVKGFEPRDSSCEELWPPSVPETDE